MAVWTFSNTALMDDDGQWEILAKLLQLENAGASVGGGAAAAAAAFYAQAQNHFAAVAVADAAAQNFYASQALSNSLLLAENTAIFNTLNTGVTHVDLTALLTELGQKTEPADAQLVRGSMSVVSAEFTRPADTTQYAINDVVGPATTPAVMTFTNVARIADGTGYVTNVRIVKSTNATTNALFRLWLYNTAITPIADNSPFTLLYTNRAVRLGYVDVVLTTEGAGSDSASAFIANINMKFNCTGGSRNLYGVLEAKQAYTPASGEKFWVELTSSLN